MAALALVGAIGLQAAAEVQAAPGKLPTKLPPAQTLPGTFEPAPDPPPSNNPHAGHTANLPDTVLPATLPDPCPLPTECPATDDDRDGIPDAWEDKLAARFAPELRLPPSSKDWTRPANVDWYLERVHMRFDHHGCPDCEIIAKGNATQDNLATQGHKGKNGFCGHGSTVYRSSRSDKFFLQPPDDAVHNGAPKSEWKAYVHVKRSTVGAYDVQYWFFYAYNDFVGSFNHEGDWEHITVTTDEQGAFHSAHYGQHEGGTDYGKEQLSFVLETHPVVYVADGSHASYPNVGSHDIPNVPRNDDQTYAGGPVWQTWKKWVNVGERRRTRNGQRFLRYGGRWGEIGNTPWTSGPVTPTFQDAWDGR